MVEAVLEHNRLLPLFARFNIRMGFGEQSVEEVCNSHGVNPDFFLEIAKTYLDESYSPHEDLVAFSLKDMVTYLKATHTYYVDVAIPRMEKKILQLLDQSNLSGKEKGLVSGFFNDYKQDFLIHISHEEKEILPYILELEKQAHGKKSDGGQIKLLKHYPITEFANEHDRLEYSLENLSKLIIKYLPPFNDQDLCVQVLQDLAELVKDLADHADMEDKVLIPRVTELEQRLILNSGAP